MDSNDKPAYSFFVAGHPYGSPDKKSIGLDSALLSELIICSKDTSIHFGFLTGDLVKHSNQESWDEIIKNLNKLDTKEIHVAPGNHDVKDRALYQEYFDQFYYSFTHQNDLFFILDGNIDGWNISGEQLNFVENELTNFDESLGNIFVFTHQLIWLDKEPYKNIGYNSPEGKSDTLTFWPELAPIFKNKQCETFFFAGDVGAFDWATSAFHHQEDNLTFIASGIGGGVKDNYIIVDVFEDKHVEFRLKSTIRGKDLGKLEDY